jgi:hypothetical protein
MDANDLQIIGWREYLALPDFGVRAIKVKVDTGARSSSLHAFEIEPFSKHGVEHVRFKIHPIQKSDAREVVAECPVLDYRSVRSSSGESSFRFVVQTNVTLLGSTWPIELTLANRDQMGFRMLLGRQAMRGHMLVDPGRSYVGGKPKRKRLQ